MCSVTSVYGERCKECVPVVCDGQGTTLKVVQSQILLEFGPPLMTSLQEVIALSVRYS